MSGKERSFSHFLFKSFCAVIVPLLLQSHLFGQQERRQTLQELISGSQFERGDKSSKYELHKYEDFQVNGCDLQWTGTEQIIEKRQQTSLIVQMLSVSAGDIDDKSFRLDDYYQGKQLSFTMKEQTFIKANLKTVYADLSEEEGSSFQTGYGFYFTKPEIAKQVLTELSQKITSCKK